MEQLDSLKEKFASLLGKKSSIVGLDIGTSSVKIVQLSGDDFHNMKVVAHASEAIPKEFITDGMIDPARLEEMGAVVRRCWEKSGATSKNVAVALPSSFIIEKKVVLPEFTNNEELEYHVKSEVSTHIPFDLDDVNLDYTVLGPADTDGDNNVLFAVTKKDKLENLVAVVQYAGLNPVIVDIEKYALTNALHLMINPDDAEDRNIVLIDFAANDTKIWIIRNFNVVYSREIQVGGAHLDEIIAVTYGLSIEEASRQKKEGSLPEDFHSTILVPFLDNFVFELHQSLQIFKDTSNYDSIDAIILVGGSAGLVGLDDFMAKNFEGELETPPMIGRLLSTMSASDNVSSSELAQQETGLFIATGLALRDLFK